MLYLCFTNQNFFIMRNFILISFFAIMFSSCNNEDESQRVVIDQTALELNSFDELKTLKSGVEIAKKGDDYIYLGVVQHLK